MFIPQVHSFMFSIDVLLPVPQPPTSAARRGSFSPDLSRFDAVLIIAGSDKRHAVTRARKVNILLSKAFKDQRGLVSKLAVLAAPEGKAEQDRLIYQG